MVAFLILGCGYTGERVARRLLDRGARVHVTAREPERLSALAERGAGVSALDLGEPRSFEALRGVAADLVPGLCVLSSIPPMGSMRGTEALHGLLAAIAPDRLVHLSSTAVYGETFEVDERTPASPADAEGRLRLEAERAVAAGTWGTLVLRPAAVYGPGRGVHAFLRRGTLGRVRDVEKVVSRVHVDDLAELCEAALEAKVSGAFPVADDEPASTREVAQFCEALGLPRLATPVGAGLAGSRGRRVNGGKIREMLGVSLRYPTFRIGIPAALAEEEVLESPLRPYC